MFLGIVLLKFWVWMKEFDILDFIFGFYVKNYPDGQSPRSKIAHPGQNVRNILVVVCFPRFFLCFFSEVFALFFYKGRIHPNTLQIFLKSSQILPL